MKRVLCICPCFKRLVFIFLFSQIHHNFAQSYGGNAVGHSDILKANQMVNEGNKEEGFKLMKATAVSFPENWAIQKFTFHPISEGK